VEPFDDHTSPKTCLGDVRDKTAPKVRWLPQESLKLHCHVLQLVKGTLSTTDRREISVYDMHFAWLHGGLSYHGRNWMVQWERESTQWPGLL
jgi:hypothetical protein